MGTVVILKTDGTAVKLNDDFSMLIFDTRGFLSTFYYLREKYVYYGTDDFRKEDKVHANASGYFIGAGYFSEKGYLGYIAKNNPSLKTLSKGLDLLKYMAKVGDEVEVTLLDFGTPYDKYFKSKTCKFILEVEGKGVRKYKDPKTGELIIPKVIVSQIQEDKDMNSRPTGLFYAKIFGDFFNDNKNVNGKEKWALKPEEKESFSKIATFIVFKINEIVETIFPLILSPLSLRRIEDVAEGKLDEKSLGFLENAVYNMNKDWGYYFTLTPDHPTLGKMNPIFSGLPDYDEFNDYYNALVSFYEKMYVAGELLSLQDEKYRFTTILEILPFRAVRSIPLKIRLAKLAEFIKDTIIASSKENLVLKIMCSFSKDEADDVLEFLLDICDNPKTNFEVLFGKMDDVRLGRYPYMEHLVSEATNKRYFTTAVYELWKTSTYNMYYSANDGDLNDNSINDHSYFRSPAGKNEINENCVLSLDLTIENARAEVKGIKSEKAHFESSFAGTRINISGMKEYTIPGTAPFYLTDLRKEPFGSFHLYQPISIVGFEPDLECVIPKTSFIPAFLFHYAVDFTELKKFDENLSFAIDVALFVAETYFTGGESVFGKMKYLKYVTKVGVAMKKGLKAKEVVLAWHGVYNGLLAMNLTADMFFAFDDFFKISEGNEDLRKLREALSELFMWITITTAGTSVASRKKVFYSARRTQKRLEEIPPTQETPFSDNLQDLLDIITADKDMIVPYAIDELIDDYPVLSAKLQDILDKKGVFNESGENFPFELVEILTAKANIEIYGKFNAEPEALDLYNKLDKLPDFQKLILYYEEFYRITKIHNLKKGVPIDPIVNEATNVKKIPVFSEKVYIKSAEDTFKVTNQVLLTILQVNDLLNYLPNSNITLSDRYDIIIKSFTCVKQANYSQIKSFIENYAFLLDSGRPYCFSRYEDLLIFKDEVRPLFEKYGLGTDLVFSGSSLLEMVPDSVDLTVYLDGISYNNLKKHYQYILRRIDKYQVDSREKNIYINEMKKIVQLFNSSTNVLKNSKLKLESLIHFEVINDVPILKTFQDEFRSLPSVKKIAERQEINFVIYNAKQGDRRVNLGPELTVKI
ncbi:hypothetical protein [Pedobacter gandavensis]|uniref:hypothetical protein n=1 Tax=Pedobacter gandavensis TaxID=2679963 RepID=UPI00292D6724|nr:hypothetical protein [Pedobacter gandavensis]